MARWDRRPPRGTEPLNARSALGVRALLSGLALAAGTAAAVIFGVRAARDRDADAALWTAAAVCAVIAVIAAVDLWVIRRRTRPP
ncbi:MAG TPA: DUF6343 family protein [Thermomonospora sp.]|nr:DUF6343 family protein [Thermomonospora sp.]